MTSCALVVPLRDFGTAKTRLSEILSSAQRSDLAELCAERVLDRTADCHRIVVCDCDAVEFWALDRSIDCVRVAETGLNAALTAALPDIRRLVPGADLVIAHGDIVDPHGLDGIIASRTDDRTDSVIVPDRRRDGTNVLCLGARVASDWTFAYGPGSFERHRSHALSRGWSVSVLVDDGLATDIDTPEDLLEPRVRTFLAAHFPEWSLPEQDRP